MILLPDANPKSNAKAINRPFLVAKSDAVAAGSQRARVVMRHCEIMRIMVLNLPILSAKRPGAHLPKKEPAFRIESSW